MALVVFQQFDPGSLYLERALGYETGMGLAQPVMYSTPGVQTSPPLPGGIRGVRFPKIVAGPTGTAGAAAGADVRWPDTRGDLHGGDSSGTNNWLDIRHSRN